MDKRVEWKSDGGGVDCCVGDVEIENGMKRTAKKSAR